MFSFFVYDVGSSTLCLGLKILRTIPLCVED
jgi:hypothetical protein